MKRQIKIKLSCLSVTALLFAAFTANAQQPNSLNPTGFVGVGTNLPSICLDVHTDMEPVTGFNQRSVRIVNQMGDFTSVSPVDPRPIFTIEREWQAAGGGTYSGPTYFEVSDHGNVYIDGSTTVNKTLGCTNFGAINDASIGGNATITGNTDVGGNLSVTGNTTLSQNLSLPGYANGNQRMLTIDGSGNLTPTFMPNTNFGDNLSVSGTSLSLRNGGTTLSTVTLPTPSATGDNLGNHSATNTLSMNNHSIVGVSSLDMTGNIYLAYNDITAVDELVFGNGKKIAGTSASTNIEVTVGTGNRFHVNGDITASGTITANYSDRRFKKDIHALSGVREKLGKLSAYEYYFRADEFPEKYLDNRKHYGLIAQDVKEVFPILAPVADEEGHMAVNYIEFIPLLLQALNEEDQQVKSLEAKTESLKSELAEVKAMLNASKQGASGNSTGIGNNTTGNDIKSVLEQNTPNPFNAETTIGYSIAEKYTKASIGIYDLNGREVKQLALETSKGKITIPANTLQPGMYVYSLIVDSKLIDSKRMVMME